VQRSGPAFDNEVVMTMSFEPMKTATGGAYTDTLTVEIATN